MNARFPDVLGDFKVVQVANPGAGNIWHYTPDANTIVRPLFIRCLLTASAVVANRYFRVEFEIPNGTLVLASPALVIQTASQAIRYNLSPGGYDPAPITTNHSLHLPGLFITENDDIVGQATGMDPGDVFSDIFLGVLEWRV